MSIYLGNIQFNEVEEKLGYKLTEDDRTLWDIFHNNNAELEGMDHCFHVFDIPRCIKVKGRDAKDAILKIFTHDKIVNPVGKFQVYEVKPKKT